MSALLIVGLSIAAIAMIIGGLMMIVAAFREHILWGLGYLFVPFVSLIFIVRYWKEARVGFVVSTLGLVIFAGTLFAAPEVRAALTSQLPGVVPLAAEPAKPKDLSAEIQEHRDRIERLEAQLAQAGPELARTFKELESKRVALKPADQAAIGQFNLEAAAYQARNAEMKKVSQELLTTKQGLDNLLNERSRARAETANPAKGKRVVMYTTSTCGACKLAKQYFAQKGIGFEELDIERSQPAMAEFRRLGGRGVPLILVGDKRLEGFSPQAVDALL